MPIPTDNYSKEILDSLYVIGTGRRIFDMQDNTFIITGYLFDTTGFPDIYMLKINNNFDTIWTKRFGGAKQDISYFSNRTDDGGFIFTGVSDSYGTNGDMILPILFLVPVAVAFRSPSRYTFTVDLFTV